MHPLSTALAQIFDVRSPNQWMHEASALPTPERLFGDLWLEGELAILFADTGVGKSALSVQIADSIARGSGVGPFAVTDRNQTVLYLDFELTAKQFELRYSAVGPEKSRPEKHHRFADSFLRVEPLPGAGDQPLAGLIEPFVRETGARVLIVDNITWLRRSAESTREAVPLMKELHRLRRRFGLSVLVVAHTPKRDHRRPLTVNDLQGAKAIADYADSIFAIGRCAGEPDHRYVKQIKARSCRLAYGADNVPVFSLAKTGSFLGFSFIGFRSESEALRPPASAFDSEALARIEQLRDIGMSIREIAAEIGVPRSTVHRHLAARAEEESDRSLRGPSVDPYYFPGREEYDEALADPRLEGAFGDDSSAAHLLLREYYLIDAARSRARKIFMKTGAAPPLCDDPAYREFKNSLDAHTGDASDRDASACDADRSAPPSPSKIHFPYFLPVRFDASDRENFIESEDSTGRPVLYYRFDSKGVLNRFEYRLCGYDVTRLHGPPAPGPVIPAGPDQ